MKKTVFRFKIYLFSLLFLFIFGWWFWKIYLPESLQSYSYTQTVQKDQNLIVSQPYKNGLVVLQYIGFTVGFDTLRKNPAWVSCHLKSEWLKAEKTLAERDFKPDPDLPVHWMSDLADFKRSGYDRGHLARQADMRGRSLVCEQQACFLVNISPQKADFNQTTWLNLENAVQRWTHQTGDLWVIAGPWFDNKRELLNHNTDIPDGFYKIVVKNQQGRIAFQSFLFQQNDRSLDLAAYSVPIDSVEKLTGIDFFADLPDSLENLVEQQKFKLWKNWR